MESILFRYRKVAWLKNITESGASFGKSEADKRNIILTNGLALVTSLAVVALMIFHRVFVSPLPSVINWLYIGFLLFMLPIWLNRNGYTNISRVLVCWLPPVFLIFVSYQ